MQYVQNGQIKHFTNGLKNDICEKLFYSWNMMNVLKIADRDRNSLIGQN